MEQLTFTYEMGVVCALLAFTVFLFVSEIVRIDLSAILVLVLIGLLSYLPGLGNLADVPHLFDGFASNAVISIIAVMIVGAGLDKTGIMNKVAAVILKYGGTAENRVLPIISGTVGVISSFMQNVGAAALFLPVVSRISSRSGIPLSRLLMPMGFCAILGGTMTMVGSSPLILLNDLIQTANDGLPDDQREAVILIGASGFSYEEAAEICGCAIGTMKSRVSRARTRLQDVLKVSGEGDYGPDAVAAQVTSSPHL